MTLPANHPQRVLLNDEVHARPPEPMAAPGRLSYLALLCDAEAREASYQAVCALAATCGVAPPEPGESHFSADLFAFRIKWEKHTEFVRFTFFVPGASPVAGPGTIDEPFARTALAAVPAEWVRNLPGQVMVAAHLVLVAGGVGDPGTVGAGSFPRNAVVGALVAGGIGAAFTDFHIYPDGFSRIVVQDDPGGTGGMTRWQAGRVVQWLLEIETYRMMALLALPVAQGLAPVIARCEQELARITAAMVVAGEADEAVLLDRLTRLAAEIDSRQSDTLYRFSAAAAYDDIVQGRIQELREGRIPGLQTIQEFTERRMAPAMNTCRSVSTRQEELSRRVARATQLLATRVGVTRERQSQGLLAAMNRRVKQQLHLQSTVEGLSIAAVTYYVVGLIGHLAEGLHASGLPVQPAIAMGLSIPVVAVLMALGLRRVRRIVKDD